MPKEIYIIGSGISGLIAAYELEQEGYHPIVIEKTDMVGGRVKTLEENGYALDLGFQVLLDAYPNAKKYLDLEGLDLIHLASGALIYAEGKSYLIGDPLRDWSVLFSTLFADIGSFKDKINIFKLNQKLKKKSLEDIFASPEKTTIAYLRDFGFSEKIIARFFKPFFTGIFLETQLHTSSRMFEFVYKMFGEGDACIPASGIGAISNQLKNKLKKTSFRFETEVQEINNHKIKLQSGEIIEHEGVIIATQASRILPGLRNQNTDWKSCHCLYFEVDQTNIPENTIALNTQSESLVNNYYAYQDKQNGKTILSATAVKDRAVDITSIIAEIQEQTGAKQVHLLHHYEIKQALPDITNLQMTVDPSESQIQENIFLAGDYLLNGSLNAAMESGRLAAQGLMEKKKSLWDNLENRKN